MIMYRTSDMFVTTQCIFTMLPLRRSNTLTVESSRSRCWPPDNCRAILAFDTKWATQCLWQSRGTAAMCRTLTSWCSVRWVVDNPRHCLTRKANNGARSSLSSSMIVIKSEFAHPARRCVSGKCWTYSMRHLVLKCTKSIKISSFCLDTNEKATSISKEIKINSLWVSLIMSRKLSF